MYDCAQPQGDAETSDTLGKPPDEPPGAGKNPRLRTGRRVIPDSSVVVAILLREPGHEVLVEKLMGRPDHPPRPGKEAGLMRMHH
jgi:hypothetical protein